MSTNVNQKSMRHVKTFFVILALYLAPRMVAAQDGMMKVPDIMLFQNSNEESLTLTVPYTGSFIQSKLYLEPPNNTTATGAWKGASESGVDLQYWSYNDETKEAFFTLSALGAQPGVYYLRMVQVDYMEEDLVIKQIITPVSNYFTVYVVGEYDRFIGVTPIEDEDLDGTPMMYYEVKTRNIDMGLYENVTVYGESDIFIHLDIHFVDEYGMGVGSLGHVLFTKPAGTYRIRITCEGVTSNEFDYIVYLQAPFGVYPKNLPDGTLGTAYHQTFYLTGTQPITWTVESGNLPNGLSLNATTGTISGIPIAIGTFNFTVKEANEAGSATEMLSITITGEDECLSPIILVKNLNTGNVDEEYGDTMGLIIGTLPIEWSIVTGNLPEGLELDTASGIIYGIPVKAETANFTIQVENACGKDTLQLSITIDDAVGIVEISTVQIKVYPNCTNGELRVTSNELEMENIQIFDLMGRMQKVEIKKTATEIMLDISHLPSGVYFLRIGTKSGKITQKVIRE